MLRALLNRLRAERRRKKRAASVRSFGATPYGYCPDPPRRRSQAHAPAVGQPRGRARRNAPPAGARFRRGHRRPEPPWRRRTLLLLRTAFALLFLYSAVSLTRYGVDYFRARQASEQLRAAYHEAVTAAADEAAVLASSPFTVNSLSGGAQEAEVAEAAQEAQAAEVAEPAEASASAQAPAADAGEQTPETPGLLEEIPYPDNPNAKISAQFQKIRRQNDDIIGWLTIEDMLDEAVVQRDNSYYLNRDYRGYHNANGAIFLDESCDLSTRPYTLILYGHNMKSGLMFGGLRNYETLSFYQNNAFITFDTAYEDGQYVIFAVSTLLVDPGHWDAVNLWNLYSSYAATRQTVLDELLAHSVFRNGIEVTAEDQLLLLVTCVEDDAERRIVAARRIREDESLERLTYFVEHAQYR